MKRYALCVLVAGVCILIGPTEQISEYLVVEQPKKKRASVSVQGVAQIMATVLKVSAGCVEQVGLLQQRLVDLLSDAVNNGRKSSLAHRPGRQREKMQKKLRELYTQIDTLNKAVERCLCIFEMDMHCESKQSLSV